jgi:PKD repeat protein
MGIFKSILSATLLGVIANSPALAYDLIDLGEYVEPWDDMGGVTDLHALVSAEGWVLTSATTINDNGDITGTGTLGGVPHGFVLSTGTISPPPPALNEPPVVVASADVTSGKAPLIISFDSSASDDPDGTIDGYFWDFMDGSFSTEANPSHTFSSTGTYSVTLTVTDDSGMTASDNITIKVRKGRRK